MITIKYTYEGRSRKGELLTGKLEAETRDMAAELLASQGIFPLSIKESNNNETSYLIKMRSLIALTKMISDEDLILFTRQLATLINAGLPLLVNIETLSQQVKSKIFKDVLITVYDDIKGGDSLSNALSKHKNIFPGIYIHMIKAGEVGGLLEEVLMRLADLMEKERETRKRVNSAIRYPKLVLIAISFAFFIVMMYVIPQFTDTFARFESNLPLPTKILIGTNNFIRSYWYLVVILSVNGFILYKRYKNTSKGKMVLDKTKLRIPVFGELFIKVAMSRFSRTFAALARAGIPVLTALEVASETSENVFIVKLMEGVADKVDKGATIAQAMESNPYFPSIVKQMVSVGEETGQLDTMLDKVAQYYDEDVNHIITNLPTLIEPILILFLGIMVLILALGIFLPMWNMMSLFS